MAFQIGHFLNQLVNSNVSDSQKTPSAAQTMAATENGSSIPPSVKAMLAGETLTGTVSNIADNQVTLTLSSGENIMARLAEGTALELGQNMTFLIQENTTQSLALKPLGMDAQQSVMTQKALEAAGLAVNEANVAIVEELLSKNMSIGSDTLNEMIKNNLKFPDASLSTIADLMKLDIPVTEENIAQFQAYANLEHQLDGQLQNISQGFSDSLAQLAQQGTSAQELSSYLSNVSEALYAETPENFVSENVTTALPQEQVTQLVTQLKETFGAQAEPLAQAVEQGKVSVKEALSQISQFIADTAKQEQTDGKMANVIKDNSRLLRHFFEGTGIKSLTEAAWKETLYLTPQMVAKEDSIKNYYKKVRSTLEKVSAEVEKNDANSGLAKGLGDIKSNIDFMNDLNKNMTYFQMPVKFSESTGNGELYVFTNKKSLQNNKDNVSAMLHLDMEYLGPVDIYVMLAGKNVSTKFYLESEELLDFVYEHIDQLNERLEKLGYTTHCEMNVLDDKGFQFVDDFIEKDIPTNATSQYIFDIKA